MHLGCTLLKWMRLVEHFASREVNILLVTSVRISLREVGLVGIILKLIFSQLGYMQLGCALLR
jgi:hypothetical protein